MKIKLIQIQETNEKYLVQGIEEYLKRLKKYCKVEIITIKPLKQAKHLTRADLQEKEAHLIREKLDNRDYSILLDEKGKQFASLEFAEKLNKISVQGYNSLAFIIGGALGSHDSLKKEVNLQLSLSEMTFSHQLIRLIFLEQIYRAFSILNNDPYHNQ